MPTKNKHDKKRRRRMRNKANLDASVDKTPEDDVPIGGKTKLKSSVVKEKLEEMLADAHESFSSGNFDRTLELLEDTDFSQLGKNAALDAYFLFNYASQRSGRILGSTEELRRKRDSVANVNLRNAFSALLIYSGEKPSENMLAKLKEWKPGKPEFKMLREEVLRRHDIDPNYKSFTYQELAEKERKSQAASVSQEGKIGGASNNVGDARLEESEEQALKQVIEAAQVYCKYGLYEKAHSELANNDFSGLNNNDFVLSQVLLTYAKHVTQDKLDKSAVKRLRSKSSRNKDLAHACTALLMLDGDKPSNKTVKKLQGWHPASPVLQSIKEHAFHVYEAPASVEVPDNPDPIDSLEAAVGDASSPSADSEQESRQFEFMLGVYRKRIETLSSDDTRDELVSAFDSTIAMYSDRETAKKVGMSINSCLEHTKDVSVSLNIARFFQGISDNEEARRIGDLLWSVSAKTKDPKLVSQTVEVLEHLIAEKRDLKLMHLIKSCVGNTLPLSLAFVYVDSAEEAEKSEDIDKTIKYYEKALDISPDLYAIQNSLGHYLEVTGRHKEAIARFRKSVEIEEHPVNCFNLGLVLGRNQEYEESIKYLRKAIELDPLRVDAYEMLGASLESSGQYSEALQNYEKARDMKPADPSIILGVARNHKYLGDLKEAVKAAQEADQLYEKLSAKEKDDYKGLKERITAFLEEEDMKQAAQALENQEIEPIAPEPLIEPIAPEPVLEPVAAETPPVLSIEEKIAESLKFLEGIDPELHNHAKYLYENEQKGLTDLEVNTFWKLSKAGKLDELRNHISSNLYLRGGDCNVENDFEKAIEYLNRSVAINPDHADAQNNLGHALNNVGKIDESLAAFEKAVALRPDDALINSNLGIMLKKKGRIEEAEMQFRKAVELNKYYWRSHADLTYLLMSLDNYDGAVETAIAALNIFNNSPNEEKQKNEHLKRIFDYLDNDKMKNAVLDYDPKQVREPIAPEPPEPEPPKPPSPFSTDFIEESRKRINRKAERLAKRALASYDIFSESFDDQIDMQSLEAILVLSSHADSEEIYKVLIKRSVGPDHQATAYAKAKEYFRSYIARKIKSSQGLDVSMFSGFFDDLVSERVKKDSYLALRLDFASALAEAELPESIQDAERRNFEFGVQELIRDTLYSRAELAFEQGDYLLAKGILEGKDFQNVTSCPHNTLLAKIFFAEGNLDKAETNISAAVEYEMVNNSQGLQAFIGNIPKDNKHRGTRMRFAASIMQRLKGFTEADEPLVPAMLEMDSLISYSIDIVETYYQEEDFQKVCSLFTDLKRIDRSRTNSILFNVPETFLDVMQAFMLNGDYDTPAELFGDYASKRLKGVDDKAKACDELVQMADGLFMKPKIRFSQGIDYNKLKFYDKIESATQEHPVPESLSEKQQNLVFEVANYLIRKREFSKFIELVDERANLFRSGPQPFDHLSKYKNLDIMAWYLFSQYRLNQKLSRADINQALEYCNDPDREGIFSAFYLLTYPSHERLFKEFKKKPRNKKLIKKARKLKQKHWPELYVKDIKKSALKGQPFSYRKGLGIVVGLAVVAAPYMSWGGGFDEWARLLGSNEGKQSQKQSQVVSAPEVFRIDNDYLEKKVEAYKASKRRLFKEITAFDQKSKKVKPSKKDSLYRNTITSAYNSLANSEYVGAAKHLGEAIKQKPETRDKNIAIMRQMLAFLYSKNEFEQLADAYMKFENLTAHDNLDFHYELSDAFVYEMVARSYAQDNNLCIARTYQRSAELASEGKLLVDPSIEEEITANKIKCE